MKNSLLIVSLGLPSRAFRCPVAVVASILSTCLWFPQLYFDLTKRSAQKMHLWGDRRAHIVGND